MTPPIINPKLILLLPKVKKNQKKNIICPSIKEEGKEKEEKIGKDKASNKLCGKKRKNGDQIEYITREQKKNKIDDEDKCN